MNFSNQARGEHDRAKADHFEQQAGILVECQACGKAVPEVRQVRGLGRWDKPKFICADCARKGKP